MPGAFDFQRFYYFQGIGALGFSLKPPQIIEKAEQNDPAFFLERLRKTISDEIYKVLEPRVAGITAALMTGERAAISEEDWTALRYSGLAHIISISGLHVALVAAPVFFVVRLFLAAIPFLALRWPIKKIAACAALIACCAYVAIVVPNVPTYRALLMTGIGLLAIMLDRSPFSLRLVAFAAAVVLLFSPDSVWSASFQMSFAAVTALVAVADLMRPYWSSYIRNGGRGRKIIVYLAGSIMTTLVASLATNPFSSFHFQQIASYSVIANALAIPLTGLLIMPMLVMSFLLMPFGFAEFPLRLMGHGITWMLEIAQDVAALPGAVIHTPAWPLAALGLFVVAGLCLILLAGRVKRVCIPLLCAGLIVILLSKDSVVLVASSGRLIMVNAKESAFISSKRREKFALETWQKRIDLNSEQLVAWPREGTATSGDAQVNCDSQVCRISLPGLNISTGQDLYDLQQDCEWANVMIVPGKDMKSCGKADIYDKWRLRETGALSIMKDGEIRTVREDQGMRPWSTWPKSRF
jgi:competence protein ComEC